MDAIAGCIETADAAALNDAADLGRRILWIRTGATPTSQAEDIFLRNGYALWWETASLEDGPGSTLPPADVLILELTHADLSALTFCRKLSEAHPGALLVIAPRIGALERVAILEFGADGVLPASVHPIELLARVRALLRRAARSRPGVKTHTPPEWRFEATTGNIRSNTGGVVQLAPADTELLLAFAVRAGQLVDRATLVRVLHDEAAPATARSIDARVARLRRALAPCEAAGVIRTIRGRGYVWEPSSTFQLVNLQPRAVGE